VVRFRVRAKQQETALISKAARKLGLSTTQFLTDLFRGDGYPLHSPSPYRLWFAFGLPAVRMNYLVMGNRIDGHSLLR
jgi:hypothetical protein